MSNLQIVWLRRDLRLSDQPALYAAAACGPIIAVYVLDDERPGERKLGGASRWWLHGSLDALKRQLSARGARLILRRGDVVDQLCGVARETGASSVHALRHYEPWWRKAEEELADQVRLHLYDGNFLMPPCSVTTAAGQPYKIFTPFYKAISLRLPAREVLPEPSLTLPAAWPRSDELDDWQLRPVRPDWAGGLRTEWDPGEQAAQTRLDHFLDRVMHYERDRNLPSTQGTSRLSPHLHFGEISPAQVHQALQGVRGEGATSFRREIIWRDYAQSVLCQYPRYPEQSHGGHFDRMSWRSPTGSPSAGHELQAWQAGRTGYPIVDAGMRQLWTTGWMHNRVRMIAASFLTKHLLIDWRFGERWFWDTLVDADYANNGVNWQWVAGTGLDANMFVRIMAPLSQSEKFGAADYIREYVPELAHLSDDEIHDPPNNVRPEAYPAKLISHRNARERALAAYRNMKGG